VENEDKMRKTTGKGESEWEPFAEKFVMNVHGKKSWPVWAAKLNREVIRWAHAELPIVVVKKAMKVVPPVVSFRGAGQRRGKKVCRTGALKRRSVSRESGTVVRRNNVNWMNGHR
jgi:hypothetical protein